jgi:hypothetical protein
VTSRRGYSAAGLLARTSAHNGIYNNPRPQTSLTPTSALTRALLRRWRLHDCKTCRTTTALLQYHSSNCWCCIPDHCRTPTLGASAKRNLPQDGRDVYKQRRWSFPWAGVHPLPSERSLQCTRAPSLDSWRRHGPRRARKILFSIQSHHLCGEKKEEMLGPLTTPTPTQPRRPGRHSRGHEGRSRWHRCW